MRWLCDVILINYTVLPITNTWCNYKIMIVYYKSNVRMYRLAAYHQCTCSMGCFHAGSRHVIPARVFFRCRKEKLICSCKQLHFLCFSLVAELLQSSSVILLSSANTYSASLFSVFSFCLFQTEWSEDGDSETGTSKVSSTLTGLSWSLEEGMQDCDDNFAYPWSWWIFNGRTILSVLIAASLKYRIGDKITGSVWVWHYELMALQCDIRTAMRDNIIWCTGSFESCVRYLWILHLKEWYICMMVCIFCNIHINNNVLSSFVFSLQYLHHTN